MNPNLTRQLFLNALQGSEPHWKVLEVVQAKQIEPPELFFAKQLSAESGVNLSSAQRSVQSLLRLDMIELRLNSSPDRRILLSRKESPGWAIVGNIIKLMDEYYPVEQEATS